MTIITLLYRNPYLLWVGCLVLLVAGLAALRGLPRIEDPRLTNRNPIVLAPFPGADAERVETLVTDEIEEKLRSIPEIKELESTSRAGMSSISITLNDDVGPTSNEAVFSKIRDRVAQANLPPNVGRPLVDDQRGAVAFTTIAALAWWHDSPPRPGILRRHARELADRLRSLPGTELVRLYGQPEEELVVTVDEAKTAGLRLSARDLAHAIANADIKAPSGSVRTGGNELVVEMKGQFDSIDRIGEVPVQFDGAGRVTRLDSVAQITRGWKQPDAALAYADGKRAVYVAARAKPDVRVDQWSRKANRIIEAYQNDLGSGVGLTTFFDQSRYTRQRLGDLAGNLFAGGVLIVVIVFVVMGWRRSLIVGLALPLVVSATLFGMLVAGGSLQQMSIFGIILALGLLIDNAIVVVDEVRRRRLQGRDRLGAARAAVGHLGVPLIASTMTTVLAFAPIILLPGNVGEFVGSIGGSVIIAVVASLVIAMTWIAALAARYDADVSASSPGFWRDGFRSERLTDRYRRTLSLLLKRPVVAIAVSVSLPVFGFALATQLGSQFFPRVDRDMFQVEVWLPPQATVKRTAAVARGVERELRRSSDVRQVHWLIGGSLPSVFYNLVMNKDGAGNYAHAIVTTRDRDAVKPLIANLQGRLERAVPEAQVVISQFGQGPPVDAPIQIRVFGPSLDELQRIGEGIRRIVQHHRSVVHTRVSLPPGKPVLVVHPDEHAVRLAGLRLTDLASQLNSNLDGFVGGALLEENEELPVRVRYSDNVRNDLSRLRTLSVRSPDHPNWMPLASVASVSLEPQIGEITRRDGFRCNTIEGYVTSDALPIDVTAEVVSQIRDFGVRMPAGYRLEIGGDSEEQSDAMKNLVTYVPVLVTITLASLVLAFRSVLLALVLVAVAVLSVGLSFLSTWAFGFPISFNTLLGSLGLMGVALNDNIVVISAIRSHPLAAQGDPDAIVEEIVNCTRHILSTTLTTAGGFLPLILGGGDFWPPLAVVIAVGVVGATGLALLFVPATYRLIARWLGPAPVPS